MPTEQAQSPAMTAPARRTNFGAAALAFALALAIPWVLADLSQRFVYRLPARIEQNISNFIFDFGFFWSLLTLLLIVVGLFRRGSSRILALAALVVLALPWLLMTVLA